MDKEKKNGLVLGGGGAKGCYEVGCWQAFEALDMHFDVVAGTSIGALVAAIYTQQTLPPLVEFVQHMEPDDIVADMPDIPENPESLLENREELLQFLRHTIRHGTDISPLKEAFEKMFDWQKFTESPIDFACMTFNVTKMEAVPWYKKDLTPEDAVSVILASASCFPAFPMMDINGESYIDGGFADNLPFQLAQEMGAETLTVIDVKGPGRYQPLPSGCTVLEPVVHLGNFLDFSQENCVRSRRLGFLETMKRHDRFAGWLYTFTKDSWPRMYMVSQYVSMQLREYGIVTETPLAKSLFNTYLGYQPALLVSKYTADYSGGAFIEALAAAFHIPMDRLYGYDHFLEQLHEALKAVPLPHMPKSLKHAPEKLQSISREEVIVFFHSVLVHNGGKLPLRLHPVRNLFNHEYILATVWYWLYTYLKLDK